MKQIIKNSATSKIDNRLSYTSERYKGYLIVLDRGGDGYNVYDRHRELEDAGYPSREAAKNFIDELVANDDVYSAHSAEKVDWYELDWDEQIQLIKNYIRQYKGSRIFEDFAEYINEPVEDIIDAFSDAEYRGDIRIPERMQLDSEYRNDDIYSSSDVKASEDDYNPYSFMVGDQLEWSGLYGGQYKGLVTNVNDEYVTVEVMRTAEDSGDTIIDTQKFEIVTDPEGKECIIVWTYGSHAGYVYHPYEGDPDDYIHSADKYNVSDWKELASNSGSVNSSTDITASSKLWMGKYKSIDGKTHKVYFAFNSSDFEEAEQEFEDIIKEPYTYCRLLGTAPSEKLLQEDGFEKIQSSSSVEAKSYYEFSDLIKLYNDRKIKYLVPSNSNQFSTRYEIYDKNDHYMGLYEDVNDEQYKFFDDAFKVELYGEWYKLYPTYRKTYYDAINSTSVNSSTVNASDEGYVYTYCDECGKKNRVKVTFNNFNEPFNDTEYKCKYCGTNNLLTDPHSYDENGNVVEASQSYLDRIEELMNQGLDEETASREAYAEFYPDEYDADDYDDSIYSSNSSKAFTGYVRTLCNNCGHLNRVKVIFPEFNKPFEDTNYKCESCGAIDELTDPHVYDEDGYIISSTISSKLDKIRAKLLKAVHDVMTSSEFGFLDDEVEDYSAVEIVPVNDNMICIEVRAEVDYDGLWMLKEVCDPIIQKYYPDAYFDMETAGVMQAYISKDVPIKSASNDTYYMQLKRAYKNMRKFDDMDSQSADILDLEDELNSHDTPYERYEHTTDNGCTIFYDDYIKGQEFKNSDLTERETLYYKGKKFVVHYTVKDTYDAKEAFDSFKASISMIAPYDDADYYWARIYNGIIKYIYKGKVMRVNYYFNPEDMSDVDDWNLEDWYSGICDEVVQSLYESNKSIESKMVHN